MDTDALPFLRAVSYQLSAISNQLAEILILVFELGNKLEFVTFVAPAARSADS
jgi:hypothetical protein